MAVSDRVRESPDEDGQQHLQQRLLARLLGSVREQRHDALQRERPVLCHATRLHRAAKHNNKTHSGRESNAPDHERSKLRDDSLRLLLLQGGRIYNRRRGSV